MFKAPFSFEGRIRRLEYGLSYIIYYLFIISMSLLAELNEYLSFLIIIGMIPAIIFMLAQGAKRCHDRGNSGWYQIIPFYGLWMLFADGDIGENEYGPNPKGIGNTNEIDEIGKQPEE